ncbi:MAG: sensor histidine kinase [Actinobacteria bacterium]|nr:sensor histidine kinase [Actinomycetota bacterium]
MTWYDRLFERLRSFNALVVDGLLAAVCTVIGVAMSYGQDIHDDRGLIEHGFREPSPWMVLTALVACAPIAVRRRWPLPALVVSGLGVLVHILIGWPEGGLPLAVLLLTYTVGSRCQPRPAVGGLVFVAAVLVVLGLADSPGLDAVGVLGVIAQFAAAWAIGVAFRNRRAATDAKLREADERAESARQSAARALAEERLRIAQELHDIVAHSMSVIAVQAGVGAHVLDDRPEQARAALDAISATPRGTLTELRRLLGVLRGDDGARSSAPAPALSDLPRLVDDVRSAGVPVELHVEGVTDCVHAGVELSAYRVVQEALTNVIKHAGSPTRVDVRVRHEPGRLAVEVIDDGRGLSATRSSNGAAGPPADGTGHGLIGMRERVELWGGELSVGPAPGGGYRVQALLPYGEAE